MTLEELKKQRAEIDKQIRSIKDVPAKTENFTVLRLSSKKALLQFHLRNMKAKNLFCVRVVDTSEETLAGDMCNLIDCLIWQLESLKEQIKSEH